MEHIKEPVVVPSAPESPPGLGSRHYQCFMTFLLLNLAFSMRVNLSVGIVAMTTRSNLDIDLPLLPWTSSQQGIILGSFFWGYLLPQMIAGNLSRKFGPKYLLFGSCLICSLATLLSPLIALNCNWLVFCLTRIICGLCQGFFYPSCNTHLSKWAPPLERSRMFAFVFCGTQCGTMITLFVAGYLAASAWGWPSIFYVTGSLGVLWAVVWLFVGANSYDSHPSISAAEKAYIRATLVTTSDNSSQMQAPWGQIVRSKPMWALVTGHWGQNWGYWMLLGLLPSYLSHVLHFDITSNGVISALPYFLTCVIVAVFSWADDYIKKRKLLSLTVARKMWNTIALWGGAAALVAISLIDSAPAAVALLTISVTLDGGVYTGVMANPLDLSPNFAGLLMGITNGIAASSSILGPMVTGFIVQDQSDKEQWMVAFYLAAAIFFVANLVFIIFGSGEVQPWNEPQEKSKNKSDKNVL